MSVELIVIGASWGGLAALEQIIEALPPEFRTPIAIAQHRAADSGSGALQDKVLHNPAVMERLLLDLSINVTAMFRDPTFFLAFRERVVPLLRGLLVDARRHGSTCTTRRASARGADRCPRAS